MGSAHSEVSIANNTLEDEYLLLAIQTVLHNNRDKIQYITDTENADVLIKGISEEIHQKTKQFKCLTESAIKQLQQ